MSRRTTRALVLALCAALVLGLAGCGFRPLYGRYGANPGAGAIFASIYVDEMPERVGYELRNMLIDLFDSRADPTGAQYRLKVRLRENREGLALQDDASITRYNYHLVAQYELQTLERETLTKGTVRTIAAYNVVASPYATLSAEQDAQKRAAHDVAGRIQLELGVYFAQSANARP